MEHHSPISLHHLPLLLLSILLVSRTFPTSLAQGTSATTPFSDFLIGSLRSCAHNISGDVYVSSANQITIKNFSYDGLGNVAWFHIMTPKALSIHAALPDTFLPVSTSDQQGNCTGLSNRSYSQEELKITLPIVHPLTKNLTINQIKSFGVFSYGDCSNYGNVYFVHKWPALFQLLALNESLGGIGPSSAAPVICPPVVLPNSTNPKFCNPGIIK